MRWLLLVLVACRSTPQAIKPKDVAAISPASGEVSAKLIVDPNAPTVELGPNEQFIAPHLRPENRPPVYPPELVSLRLPPDTVSLRVTFDEQGAALKVEPSPIATSTDDQYREAFENAVKETLMRWKCEPPRIRKFRDGPDSDGDGKADYRIMIAQQTLKTFFDLSFSFEVVEGHPVVKSR
jgi:outer membrane biosynthesis protein TonB